MSSKQTGKTQTRKTKIQPLKKVNPYKNVMSKPLKEIVENKRILTELVEEQRLIELRQKYLFDQQLSGIITGIYHGGINLPRNLTNVPLIPFNTLQIYITFLGLVSYAADPGSRFHRTNILVMFHKLFKDISTQNNCKITPSHYYNAMRSNNLLKEFEEFTSEETQQDYTQIIKECELHKRDVCSIGHYAFGTPLNQILDFCEQTFFDKKEEDNPMFDDFCGWFMHVCEITIGDTPRWFSATNVTVNDGTTQIVTNGITFVIAPIMRLEDDDETTEPASTTDQFTKTFPERQTNASGYLNPMLEDALVYDLCSLEEISKVQGMTPDYVMLILKLLIAREVRFSIPVTPQTQGTPRKFKNTSYAFNWIDDDKDGFVAQFKDKLNDMKIYKISSEDFSVLLHILWFISNGRTVELDCIINFMDIMSTCINNFKGDAVKIKYCVNNINRFINDYVEQCAKYYHINFLTIMNGCRPNADPAEHGKTEPPGNMTQECMQVSEDTSERPIMCVVNCNNPPPPLPDFKEILKSFSPPPLPSPPPLSILHSHPGTTPSPPSAISVTNTGTNMVVKAATSVGAMLLEFLTSMLIGKPIQQEGRLADSITISNTIPQSSKRPVSYNIFDELGKPIVIVDLVDTYEAGMTIGGKRKTHKRNKPYKRKTHKRRKPYKRKTHKRSKFYNTKYRISN